MAIQSALLVAFQVICINVCRLKKKYTRNKNTIRGCDFIFTKRNSDKINNKSTQGY